MRRMHLRIFRKTIKIRRRRLVFGFSKFKRRWVLRFLARHGLFAVSSPIRSWADAGRAACSAARSQYAAGLFARSLVFFNATEARFELASGRYDASVGSVGNLSTLRVRSAGPLLLAKTGASYGGSLSPFVTTTFAIKILPFSDPEESYAAAAKTPVSISPVSPVFVFEMRRVLELGFLSSVK